MQDEVDITISKTQVACNDIGNLAISILDNCVAIDLPLKHRFTPGLYTREIFMPKGSTVISLVHKTEHPYFILSGEVSVWTDEQKWVRYCAPYIGITVQGTCRILYMHTDVVWATCHTTDGTETPEEIVLRVTEIPSDAFIGERYKKELELLKQQDQELILKENDQRNK